MKTFDKLTCQWIVEITVSNINDYRNKLIHAPQQFWSDAYTVVEVGGSNLTIGEMIDNAKTSSFYGGSPIYMTIKDSSEATLYVINLRGV